MSNRQKRKVYLQVLYKCITHFFSIYSLAADTMRSGHNDVQNKSVFFVDLSPRCCSFGQQWKSLFSLAGRCYNYSYWPRKRFGDVAAHENLMAIFKRETGGFAFKYVIDHSMNLGHAILSTVGSQKLKIMGNLKNSILRERHYLYTVVHSLNPVCFLLIRRKYVHGY